MLAPIVAGSDIVCKKLINPIRAVKKLAMIVDLMANFNHHAYSLTAILTYKYFHR